MSAPTEYPLAWPPGWPRTAAGKTEKSRMKTTIILAVNNVRNEIKLLGGSNIIISSNCKLGNSKPENTGVAAYFTYMGKQVCIPCDRWNDVQSNLQAIAKTVEALRGIERWGAKHMIEAAFSGFAALPEKASSRSWRDVLEITEAKPTPETISKAFRRLSLIHHPDKPTGSTAAFNELVEAKNTALKSL